MNFLSMDYFLMTAEKRSFTKAADALHITQQTLSTHIANLEQELDCKLFVRHVPLELTYAGEIFWQYAADFQKKYRAMQHEFADLTKNEQGILRIGISFTRCHAIMPAIITEYQRRYPHMEIQVIENANTGLQKDLMEHKIDLAIAKFPDFLPGITLSDFYEEEVVLLLADSLFHVSFPMPPQQMPYFYIFQRLSAAPALISLMAPLALSPFLSRISLH